jgi:hypothetical protein
MAWGSAYVTVATVLQQCAKREAENSVFTPSLSGERSREPPGRVGFSSLD